MASFGEELRRERELRDISIREIAEATNIPARFLESLEENNFKILPGGAYNRGFIRSYCRHIGINVDEMVNAYHLEIERQESAAAQTDRRKPPTPAPAAAAGQGSSTGVIVGVAVLVIASTFAFFYYWAGSAIRPSASSLSSASAHNVALQARVKKSGALPSIPAPPLTESANAAPAAPEPPPAEADPALLPSGEERLVRLRALETTWVQLTCAGVAQYRGDLWVGSERHIPCREPVLISADNGGAIECSIDSGEMSLLGERGEIIRNKALPLQPAGGPAPDASGTKPIRSTADVLQAAGRTS